MESVSLEDADTLTPYIKLDTGVTRKSLDFFINLEAKLDNNLNDPQYYVSSTHEISLRNFCKDSYDYRTPIIPLSFLYSDIA